MSRVIAGCLLKVIHLVVDECQTCGVPHRFIGDIVAFLRDVVGYATSTNAHVAVLSLDQEKAFDRSTGFFFMPPWLRRVLGPPLLVGLICFMPAPRVVKFNGHMIPFFWPVL